MVRLNGAAFTQRKLWIRFCSGWAGWGKRFIPDWTPILFTSKAADMLWGTVQAALNGKRVLERVSPWADCSVNQ